MATPHRLEGELEEGETGSVEALHLVLLIHFSLSITVIYAND